MLHSLLQFGFEGGRLPTVVGGDWDGIFYGKYTLHEVYVTEILYVKYL